MPISPLSTRRNRWARIADPLTRTSSGDIILIPARFPKAGILCDCAGHMILSVVTGRGPGPDIKHFRKARSSVPDVVHVESILADAGFDSEASHV